MRRDVKHAAHFAETFQILEELPVQEPDPPLAASEEPKTAIPQARLASKIRGRFGIIIAGL